MEPPPPPSSSSTTTPTPTPSFPHLTILPPSQTHPFTTPQKKITTGADLPHFLSSLAYRDLGLFILQLNRALCPRKPSANSPPSQIRTFPLHTAHATNATDATAGEPTLVARLRAVLRELERLMDEAPPEKGPRRFGNVSFRRWHALLRERVDGLLLGGCLRGLPGGGWERWGLEEEAWTEVRGYFVGGFGSEQRLDYGTGHELSFLAFLGGLWKLGLFRKDVDGDVDVDGERGAGDGEMERHLVLGVFEA